MCNISFDNVEPNHTINLKKKRNSYTIASCNYKNYAGKEENNVYYYY